MFRRIFKIALLVVASLVTLVVLSIGAILFGSKNPEAFFNWVYKHPMGFFNKDPNALLVASVADLTPGKALDVAMGEGRNAVWLATKGWDVTGFDISDEGLNQAQERAGKAGVTIDTVHSTSEDFDYGHERWDLIVLSYAFTPVPDEAYVARLRDSLKPGGLLVYEHYQQSSGSRVPGAIHSGEAEKVFKDFRILRYEEPVERGDFAFRMKQPLIQLVATR